MRRPHSENGPRAWLHQLFADRAGPLLADDPVMTPGASAVGRTRAFALGEGHTWRQVPCAACGDLPRDYPVHLVTIADSRLPHRAPWRVLAAVYLVHAFHQDIGPGELARIVHWREDPECPCFTRPADAEAEYPYHQPGREIPL